jgi:regulator of protease activity HflC (stomatin/prohibitin superfamily)
MAEYQQMDMPEFPKNGGRMILTALIGFIVVVTLWKSSVTIPGGQGGVMFKTFAGGIDTVNNYGEGWHLIAPWNDMITYEVRQQEVLEDMAVLSSNGLEITLEVSAWYQPMLKDLAKLHQEKGRNYLDRVVKPAIRSASRSVIGRYTPEEIYSTKRDAIQSEINVETKKYWINNTFN